MASVRYVDTLRLLLQAKVEFIVVGMAAGILKGAPAGAGHLLGPAHILLTTDNGDFDCLGTVDENKSFEELLPLSRIIKLDGAELRVLDLPALIAVKRRAGRAKDRAVLPVLEATLEERLRTQEAE